MALPADREGDIHSGRQQDPDAVAAWLSTFPSLKPDIPGEPRRISLDALELCPMSVEPPRIVSVILLEDVSDSEPDYL